MQIPTPVTDEIFIKMVTEQLARVTKEHPPKYNSPEEIKGFLGEEYDEVKDAVRRGRGRVTSEMLAELVDVAVVCVKASRSFYANDEARGVHGLDGDYCSPV